MKKKICVLKYTIYGNFSYIFNLYKYTTKSQNIEDMVLYKKSSQTIDEPNKISTRQSHSKKFRRTK